MGDPTVSGLRDKKGSCSTQSGLPWVSDLGSFLKLREVWVSPYLGFTLYLSVFMMFELFEALNDCLIGTKTWDRIVVNFETQIM